MDENIYETWYAIIGKIDSKDKYKSTFRMMKEFESIKEKYDIETFNQYEKACKKRMREYTKRNNNAFKINGHILESRIVKDEGIDGYVELVTLPKFIRTFEDAIDYFDDYLWISAIPSMYDCTGQALTCWRHIFERNGRFYAYHSVAYDV